MAGVIVAYDGDALQPGIYWPRFLRLVESHSRPS